MPTTDSTGHRSLLLAVTLLLVLTMTVVHAPASSAHPSGDWVRVYNPIIDGDSSHTDVSAWWATGSGTAPGNHHVVYRNWDYRNDWSMDIYARAEGKRFVTPFGSRTESGHAVQSKVVRVTPGCASGKPADGGYRVTIEARDKVTGIVLGRADLMHVDRPQVSVGRVLGGWTTVGYTKKFRSNPCYQVNTTNGIHGHVEFINKHRYACWHTYAYNKALTEQTRIGIVGQHDASARRC